MTPPASDPASFAIVCNGKSCRGPARERLSGALRAGGVRVITSRCLKVCRGPVAVVSIHDRWHVVERVKSTQAQRRLIEALQRQRSARIKKRLVEGGERRRAPDRAPLPF